MDIGGMNLIDNSTLASVTSEVLKFDRSFSNALYVLISLLCMAAIVALTTGYLILHVCCFMTTEEDQCKSCEQQERSVADSVSNSDGFQEVTPNNQGCARSTTNFSVTTKIGVSPGGVDAMGNLQPMRARRVSTSDV